jgi:acyl carrier protein
MDFSELCLRLEEQSGVELNFEALAIRSIETVSDVCAFLKEALR